jgi:hypothetical protein
MEKVTVHQSVSASSMALGRIWSATARHWLLAASAVSCAKTVAMKALATGWAEIRRDQPERAGLQAPRRVHAEVPVRSRERDFQQKSRRAAPAQLGRGDRRADRATKGQGCFGAQACRDAPRDVAHQHALPRGRDEYAGQGCTADLQRDGMRPAGARGD